MIKQKQLVPKRRFEGFKDEWKTKIFDELGSFGKTYAFSRANEGYGVYSHVHYGDIHVKYNGVINQNTVVPSLKVKGDFETLKKNDIVIADASEDYIDLGKTVVIEEPSNRKLIAGLHTFKFTPSEYLNAKFYLYYSQSDLFKKFSYKKGTGISVFGISKVNMSKMKLNIPLKNEQQKIGEFFKHLDGMIALEQRKIDKTLSLKSAYLAEMFPAEGERVPKRRFAGFTDEWEEQKLEGVVQITMGQSPNSNSYTDNPRDYILVQGNADMKNNRVFPRVWTTQVTKKANKGDLILSVRAPVGDVGKTDYDVVLGRGVASIKGNEFIFQLLIKMKNDNYWSNLSTGSTFDSINSNDIKEALVLIPESEEQIKIGEFFNKIDNSIVNYTQKLEKLKATKQAYLHEMFV